MNDKDYSPLNPATVRALADKLYEKRKSAALDIEKMVREYHHAGNTTEIRRLLRVLGQEFAASTNPNPRKGGLIGLAASAIALGKDSGNYIADLVKPVVACFSDPDSRVRYYACEALYNIVKVSRAATLKYFNDIFDGLSKLTADTDQNVKNGSDLLDRLMKDIVAESTNFDLVAFMPLLRERIYTKNPYARQFLVTWVNVLDAVPDIDMIVYLPEILDGLFHILGDQSNELRKITGAVFGEFLREIKKSPENVNYSGMINILIAHCQSGGFVDPLIQYTAISWIREFVHLSGRAMLPYASGILTAVLPCLAYEDEQRRNIREAAKSVNTNLMKLIVKEDDNDAGSDSVEQTPESELFEVKGAQILLEIGPIVEVLCRHLVHDSMQTRIATLRWIYHLHINTPKKAFNHVEEIFPLLLKTLTDPSDEVVLLDLEVLSEISANPAGNDVILDDLDTIGTDLYNSLESCHHMNKLFTKFMVSLLQLFRTDKTLLEERGSFIIRQLSLLLNAEDVYRTLSTIMLSEENPQFACQMVQTLNTILLTSTELFELRVQLKDLKTEASCLLFTCLYRSWCHSAVATLSLCLLTQNYQHACTIINMFSDIEVTVDFLTEIDKLVQLIESPIFTFLRLQLLDIQNNQYLLKSLYGLLMLLPQSDAFRTLRHRLECVPPAKFLPRDEPCTPNPMSAELASRPAKDIDFDDLLKHFLSIQANHRTARRMPRRSRDQGHQLLP